MSAMLAPTAVDATRKTVNGAMAVASAVTVTSATIATAVMSKTARNANRKRKRNVPMTVIAKNVRIRTTTMESKSQLTAV
jgi:predicted kinase